MGTESRASSSSSGPCVWPPRCVATGRRKLTILVLLLVVGCAVFVWRVRSTADQQLQSQLVDDMKQLMSSPSSSSASVILQHECSSSQILCGIQSGVINDRELHMETLKQEFHRMMAAVDGNSICRKTRHFGEKGDGGYDVCMSPTAFEPSKSNCLVYSFGISDDWTFDEDLSSYGCEVHSFDPSIGKQDHIHPPNVNFHNLGLWGDDIINNKNWTLKRLSSIRKLLGHEQRVIDVLKIDVEGAEWPFLRDVLTATGPAGGLSSVGQLLLELHTPRFNPDRLSTADLVEIIYYVRQLRDAGFRVYRNVQRNWCCTRFAPLMPSNVDEKCCHETFLVNTQLIRPATIQ